MTNCKVLSKLKWAPASCCLPFLIGLLVSPAIPAEQGTRLLAANTLQIDISSPDGVTATGCFVIDKNGDFHIERKIQKFPSRTATRTIQEGSLTPTQLADIKSRVNAPEVQSLPEWHQPVVPTANDRIQMAEIEIDRNGKSQHTGYLIWHGDSPSAQMTDPAAQQANSSKLVLDPLIQDIEKLNGRTITEGAQTKMTCENQGETAHN